MMWDSGIWLRWFLAWAVGFMVLTIVAVTFIVSELITLSRTNAELLLRMEELRQSSFEAKNRVDVIYDVLLRTAPGSAALYEARDPRRMQGQMPDLGPGGGIARSPAQQQGLRQPGSPSPVPGGRQQAAQPGGFQAPGLYPRPQTLQSLTQPVATISEIRVLGVRPLGNGGKYVSIEVRGQASTPGWEGPMLMVKPSTKQGLYAFDLRALPPTERLPSAPSQVFATTGIETAPGLREVEIRVQGRNNSKAIKVDL